MLQCGWRRGLMFVCSSREYILYSRDLYFLEMRREIVMYRTLFCNDIRDEHIGQTVRLAGWVDVIRDHGGVIFVDIRDYTGITQVVIHNEDLLKNVNRETVISVSGIVQKRDPETVNSKKMCIRDRSVAFALAKNASTRVVFPSLPCPTTATFLKFFPS